jgi:hypothetical protein
MTRFIEIHRRFRDLTEAELDAWEAEQRPTLLRAGFIV